MSHPDDQTTEFDIEALDGYIARALGADDSRHVTRRMLGGGLSQLTIMYDRTTPSANPDALDRLVVRVPPAFGPLEPYEPAVEAGLLREMAGQGVPVPNVALLETDAEIVGRPFYATEFDPGTMTAEGAGSTGMDRQRMAEALVDLLVRIHRVPVGTENGGAAGLLGHLSVKSPAGLLERWTDRLREEDVQLPAYHQFLERWLRHRIPAPSADLTIVHGDFRLANVLWGADGAVSAMMDWEESSLGDPLYDLAWMLTGSYADEDLIFGLAPRSWFIEAYESRSAVEFDRQTLLWWEVATGWSLLAMNAIAIKLQADGRYHDLRPLLYTYLNRRIAQVLLKKIVRFEEASVR
ncbi:phosphotransferase family protein [Nocardia miyunensis]|uniref:phosphotransferase family protein n=1 Tax=Nocardia miyunensis TaxID=282684 RepID=UPI0008321B1E|nr:phosphotransferase family protein [Nocardia miyunensis]